MKGVCRTCYIRSGPTCGKGARLEARSIYGAVVVVEELQEIQQLVFFVKMPFMNQILAVDAVIGPQGVEWRLLHGHHRVTRPLRHCAAPPRSTAVDPLSIDVEGQHIRAEDPCHMDGRHLQVQDQAGLCAGGS